MILTKLYEEDYLKIEEILFKEHKKLGLSTKELVVLITLFRNKNKTKLFSTLSISRQVDYNQNEIGKIVSNLIDKEFIELKLEKYNNKDREIYKLDKTLTKLEELFQSQIKKDLQEKSKNDIGETIELLEEKLNRLLRQDELDKIRTWYETYKYDHNLIIDSINSIEKGLTLIKVERLLNIDIDEDESLDPEVEKALERIYDKL